MKSDFIKSFVFWIGEGINFGGIVYLVGFLFIEVGCVVFIVQVVESCVGLQLVFVFFKESLKGFVFLLIGFGFFVYFLGISYFIVGYCFVIDLR